MLDSVEMITIKEGSFLMGASDHDRFSNRHELPRHEVNINAFLISKAPITESQFAAVMNHPQTDSQLPVINVSWNETQHFCQALDPSKKFRLPTEAEWEYIYRAGSQHPFPNKELPTLNEGNFLYDEQGNRIGKGSRSPVNTYPENSLGVDDLIGNVAEWTNSHWTSDYSEERTTNTKLMVIRGGGWDSIPRLLRCSNRDFAPPTTKRDNLGFRIALDL